MWVKFVVFSSEYENLHSYGAHEMRRFLGGQSSKGSLLACLARLLLLLVVSHLSYGLLFLVLDVLKLVGLLLVEAFSSFRGLSGERVDRSFIAVNSGLRVPNWVRVPLSPHPRAQLAGYFVHDHAVMLSLFDTLLGCKLLPFGLRLWLRQRFLSGQRVHRRRELVHHAIGGRLALQLRELLQQQVQRVGGQLHYLKIVVVHVFWDGFWVQVGEVVKVVHVRCGN